MSMFSWFANPLRFMRLSNWLAPLCYALAALLIGWGLWQGLWMVPKDDYQGGDIMRVMFIHVPAAWLAMASYMAMAVMSFIWFIWRHEVADIAAKSIAPLGACGRRSALRPDRSGASRPGAPGGNGTMPG